MSGNDESPSIDLGDCSQSTNWILDSGETAHMTPQVSYFIPVSVEDMYKYLEVLDGHYVMAEKKGQVQLKMCDDNRDIFIATLDNLLLAPDLCNMLFSIIMLMNSVHTCLFQKGVCTVFFGDKKKNAVALPHIARKKHEFWGGIKQISKSKKLSPRKKVVLELFYHRLGRRSTISLMIKYAHNTYDGRTRKDNVGRYIG